MEFAYCTLFNIDYVDKGIALYKSIRKHNKSSILYILALDQYTIDILKEENLFKTVLISLSEIEKEYIYLNELKKTRSFAEYCWTLTPHIIEYIFNNYNVKSNTYLDADLWFFQDPDLLNIEMIHNQCHTLITEHAFPDDNKKSLNEELHGKYCVQFNTFTNTAQSLALLKMWKQDVINDCEYNKRRRKAGDQKYLEKFTQKSKNVYIPKDIGVGVAPWNIKKYNLIYAESEHIMISYNNKQSEILFYHYQNIKYLTKKIINIGAGKAEKKLKMAIYYNYLKELDIIRNRLLKKNITIRARSVSRNNILSFIQKYITRYKLRDFCISDIIYLR